MGNTLSGCCGCCGNNRGSSSLYEPLLQENEREAVADLLEFLENRQETVFFEGEPLRALTTLSYSNNVDLQRSAALAFAEITERQVEEVDITVLEPLLFLLRESTDPEVQRAASAALGNLAINVPNKLKIVRLGGLEPLIKQMASGNVEVQCNAVGCVTNLATHEDNKAAIARSGALGPLIRLAKQTRDIRVQRNATGALLNMTHSEENRRELVEAGAIPVLIALLKSTDVDVVYYCTTALSNLAVDASNRSKMAKEQRLVSELMELMESPSLKIQVQAALSLRNLASDEQYQVEIAKHPQGLPRLLKLITGGNLRQPPAGSASSTPAQTPRPSVASAATAARLQHPQLVLAAVACIRNISIHPQNESKIIEAGFLKPLVDLLSSDNEEIQCHALSTLRNLAAGSGTPQSPNRQTQPQQDGSPAPAPPQTASAAQLDNKERIVDSGALDKIQKLLEFSVYTDDEKSRLGWPVISEMTACVAVLALGEKLKPRLLKSGLVKTILPLTRPSVPAEIQGNAAAILGNLATKCRDMSVFVQDWDKICSYLERFLEPLPSHGTHYHQGDEASAAFQHIALWTLLQFAEYGGEAMRKRLLERQHLIKLTQNLQEISAGVESGDEIADLTAQILRLLDNRTEADNVN